MIPCRSESPALTACISENSGNTNLQLIDWCTCFTSIFSGAEQNELFVGAVVYNEELAAWCLMDNCLIPQVALV